MTNRVFIIAEAGVNHNGDMSMAKKLIDAAVQTGADAVKFQTFKAKSLVTRNADKAQYQKETTNQDESQFEMIRKLELSHEDHVELYEYARNNNIMFLSSPFDIDSTNFLVQLGINTLKIPSGEITNYPYLKHMASLGKDIILSTGMANLTEIEFAMNTLTSCGATRSRITLLHCNTEYPTPMQDVNLTAMITLREAFKVNIGYSDHTLGIEIPIAAVALGAKVIEKHFTLDNDLPGPDHKASLCPKEFTEMVRCIRNIEVALGTGLKQPSASEEKNKPIARKSIVARQEIKKGDIFTEQNITTKRPGTGISPMSWRDVLGKTAKKSFVVDEMIEI
ncbi:N-acetylneuraminate synthase [Candidatus Uabimicrobium amorphum]|uniref:N-acetylneuraminate synthase n=1 Tax=Uabimicrobium amorphum TaxID=2596890 RepID=A0A5S9IT90_UABAM|nr:N-acetylneuraminate synthase [Candidatus Uabimicrobium amorphum]BBM87738.1 N-acetylneuraminate synthase [Candidatus Uabimicrobium amorphum]